MSYRVVKNNQSSGSGRYDIMVDGKVIEGGFFSKSAAESYAEANYSDSSRQSDARGGAQYSYSWNAPTTDCKRIKPPMR